MAAPESSNSFRLWSDDFGPANIIVDENDQILGFIDWEFAYIGPPQFVLDAPWWLLLDVSDMWEDGIENWTSIYDRRLMTWLAAMEEVEKEKSQVLCYSLHTCERAGRQVDSGSTMPLERAGHLIPSTGST